jgi:hypothetical protein
MLDDRKSGMETSHDIGMKCFLPLDFCIHHLAFRELNRLLSIIDVEFLHS